MNNRRAFLKRSAIAALALYVPSFPASIGSARITPNFPLKSRKINSTMITCYSQTGNTARHGKLMAKVLETRGVKVTSAELKDVDIDGINTHQLLIVGSPVFYYDTPKYVKRWMAGLPKINGMAVAS